jgi:pseudouridine synthase
LEQRLQKALAAGGVASRRHAEEMIASGRVAVDGTPITIPGTRVDPDTQRITVDGKPIRITPERHYIALHKPVGYVSTARDRHAPRKVTDLVNLPGARLVPAGRLDADSEGLILLSDDGDFIYRVTHPSQSVGKVYLATVKGKPSADTLKRLSRGLMLDDGVKTAPAGARWAGPGPEPGTHLVEMTLHEGRNRQVRRMLATVGHPVLRLIRIKVGPIRLDDLAPGAWRHLTPEEVAALLRGDRELAPAPGTTKVKPGARRGGAQANNARGGAGRENARGGARREERDETGHRGGPRPGPGQDHRGAAPQRVQVHQDRVHGRVPARGQRDPSGGRRGEGRGPGPERDR